jgi:hypothetical protein
MDGILQSAGITREQPLMRQGGDQGGAGVQAGE